MTVRVWVVGLTLLAASAAASSAAPPESAPKEPFYRKYLVPGNKIDDRILEQEKRIADSPLSEVVITNSVPLSEEGKAVPKFKVVSVARLLAEAIRRIHNSDSVSSLFV